MKKQKDQTRSKKPNPPPQQAQEAIPGQSVDISKLSSDDLQALIQELQSHQIELKKENDELQQAHNELEKLVVVQMAELAQVNTPLKEKFSEGVRIDRVLSQRTQEFKTLAKNSPDIIIRINRAMQYIYANPAVEMVTGIPPQTFVGKTGQELGLPLEVVTYWQESLEYVFTTGQENLIYFEFPTPDDLRYFEARIVPEFEEDGSIESALVLSRDITGRRQAQESLKTQALVLESMAEGVNVSDEQGNIFYSNPAFNVMFGYQQDELIGQHVSVLNAGPPHENQRLVAEITDQLQIKGIWAGEFNNCKKDGALFTTQARISALEISGQRYWVSVQEDISKRKQMQASLQKAYDELEIQVERRTLALSKANWRLKEEIAERQQAEKSLQQRNRELELLTHMGRAFTSTLNLDDVLVVIMEEMRQLLQVTAYSIWLLDPESGELVCRYATDIQKGLVIGWRLAPGQGIAGWVVEHNQSLIIGDTQKDKRHFKQVDQKTKTEMRSILTIPLRVKQKVTGILQVVDTRVNRFTDEDLALLEPVAATAAIAIENARLYEQSRQDAETKATLLSEVNHRVGNNFAAITNLLHIELQQAQSENLVRHQTILDDMINRVQGLATVHRMLSATEWSPLSLSELTEQVIDSSLMALPADKQVSVEVTPCTVQITPKLANSLALIVNELTTNSIKYAWPYKNKGHIAIGINQIDDLVIFEFKDNGRGYSDEVLHKGHHNTGWDLIRAIIRDSLDGEVIINNDQGAMTTLRFPMPG